MVEGLTPQLGPDDTQMKGDFEGVHNPKFQDELRETGEKTNEQRLEEIKSDLFDREMPAEYEELIKGVSFTENQEPYSEKLVRYLSMNELSIVASKIKNNIVLDLGCGQSSEMNFFSKKNQANLYIGVDLSPFISSPETSTEASTITSLSLPEETKLRPESKKIRPEFELIGDALQIRGDMLRAVSRMKSESVGVIITSGIESDGRGQITGKYTDALINEVKRVLKDEGLFLNYYSDISLNKNTREMPKIDIGFEHIDFDLRMKKSNDKKVEGDTDARIT